LSFTNVLTILFGKTLIKLMKLFHRSAGNLPGIILQKISKNYLNIFKVNCPIIACTGTNGKTTVTNFIAQMFVSEGKNIITNP